MRNKELARLEVFPWLGHPSGRAVFSPTRVNSVKVTTSENGRELLFALGSGKGPAFFLM